MVFRIPPRVVLFLCAQLCVCSLAAAQGITIDDPATAAENEDYRIQGEYVGKQRGMQVVALGDGEFDILLFEGGLPGAGWRGEPPRKLPGDADTVTEIVQGQQLEKVLRTSPTLNAPPPAGALHLFDGTAEGLQKNWQPGARITEEGLLMEGATSLARFTDYVLHLEFRTPLQSAARGQARGNSGVYHQGRYETQVLDSFGLQGRDNEAGGIYSVRSPDLNMCFPPLSWQTYDVVFTAARYDNEGKKIADARMTVRLNGVVIHNDVPVPHTTTAAPLGEGNTPGPIYLQDHGNPVRYRNIWVLPRDADREARRPIVPGFERFFAAQGEIADRESLVAGGRVLASQLGCAQCHAGAESTAGRSAPGPILTGLASRIRPDHLVQWIAHPHQVKPGTTMPEVFKGMEDQQRLQTAEAIASYLLLAGPDHVFLDRAGSRAAAQRGEKLFHTTGCLACHAPQDGRTAPQSTSIPIGAPHQKYSLDSLAQFLSDPHAIRPAGRMPRMLTPAEARDVATYLLREIVLVPGSQQFQRTVYRGSWNSLPDFASLQSLAAPEIVSSLSFEGIEPKENFAALYEAYLPITKSAKYRFIIGSDDGSRVLVDGNEVVRIDGVHPYQEGSGEVELAAGVHRLRIEYFEAGGEERLTLEIEGGDLGRADVASMVTQDPQGDLSQRLVENAFVPQPSLVAQGARAFVGYGCAQCHAFEPREGSPAIAGGPRPTAAPWDKLRPNLGCLAPMVAGPQPDYQLSPVQRQSLAAAIEASGQPLNDQSRVHETLAAANCYACHQRGDWGGPEGSRDAFFVTTMQEMGNEGRLPPPLTGVGDKLRDEAFEKILQEGAKDRPYMLTRMPAFGYDGFQELHKSIVALDRSNETSLDFAAATEKRMIADGRTLVGNEGLACIKCHTYNGEGTPGIQAIDLRTMPLRLRSEWFDRYLHNPTAYRPGTRMPASFPDGRSVLTTIADGDPPYQIAAMWQYLLLGEPDKLPSGLRPGAIELVPRERPILYRNFLVGLSPRGIAVGYPQRVHLAWDAGNMALAKMWQNQFLDAALHWQGRGPGNLAPLGDAVVSPETTSPVALLSSVKEAWPARTDKEAGYLFRGYTIDDSGRPMFRYQLGTSVITDFFVPAAAAEEEGMQGFVRELTIEGNQAGLVYRFASGNLQQIDPHTYLVDGLLRLSLEENEGVELLRIDGRDELRMVLPADRPVTIRTTFTW